MIHYTMAVPGAMHRFTGAGCQDRTAYWREGAIAASALADGAGSLRRSAQGAQAVSMMAAVWLVRRFDQLMRMPAPAVRRELAAMVTDCLASLAQREREEAEHFGSTLLAVCADARTRRFLAVHVGDGLICARRADTGEVVTLSAPERGETQNATFLTTCLDIPANHAHIRIMRGDDMDSFMLMSDGAENSLFCDDGATLSPSLGMFFEEAQRSPLRFDAALREAVEKTIRPIDDLSVSILSNVPLRQMTTFGYDQARPHGATARRVARACRDYAAARDANASRHQAARAAGWRKRDLPQRLEQMARLGVEPEAGAKNSSRLFNFIAR